MSTHWYDPKPDASVRVDVETESDAVWRRLTTALTNQRLVSVHRFPEYIRAQRDIGAAAQGPPSIDIVNDWLSPTGWSAMLVEGYVPSLTYSKMLYDQVFPVARTLRSLQNLDHSAAPDFAHDVLGHLPMLFVADYGPVLRRWGELSRTAEPQRADEVLSAALGALIDAKSAESPKASEIAALSKDLGTAQQVAVGARSRRFRFDNFFTWAMEYGLLQHEGRPAIIGGAILSSPGELQRLDCGDVTLQRFRRETCDRVVDYTVYQSIMFMAQSFADLADTLSTI